MHLGGFEISFIYSCTCRSVIVTMKKRKKRKRRKKKRGKKKKEKKQGERPGPSRTPPNRSPLVVARSLLRLRFFAPILLPARFFSFLSSSPLSLSSSASQSLSSAALPVFNSHFSEAFQSVTPRLAANTPPPPPPPSLRSSLSSSLSLYSRSLDIATTPRPNGTNKRLPFPLSAI